MEYLCKVQYLRRQYQQNSWTPHLAERAPSSPSCPSVRMVLVHAFFPWPCALPLGSFPWPYRQVGSIWTWSCLSKAWSVVLSPSTRTPIRPEVPVCTYRAVPDEASAPVTAPAAAAVKPADPRYRARRRKGLECYGDQFLSDITAQKL